MDTLAINSRFIHAALCGLVVLTLTTACLKLSPSTATKLPEDTPAVTIVPPPVTLITEEEYPRDWSEVIDLPGADDPQLLLLAERVLYPGGIDRHCDELPFHAWEVFALRLETRIAEHPSAFAHWLMAQVQLRLWWCGPTDDPIHTAADHAERALALAPYSACALAAAALTDSCLDRIDRSRERIESAINTRPDLVYPLVTAGLINRHQEHWEEAIEYYDRALELNIRAVVINLYRGHVYWELDRQAEALAAYQTLARQAPDYALGHLNCAYIYYNDDHQQEAFDALTEAIRCDERLADAHRLLGTIHYNREEYEEARQSLSWALMIDPENDNAHYYMGHYYYSSSLMGKAIEEYQRADELSPDEPETKCSIGKAYHLMGDLDNAVPALERAIELSEPGYWAYDEAVATLGEITAAPGP